MLPLKVSARCNGAWHEMILCNERLHFPHHADLDELRRQAALLQFGASTSDCGCARTLLGWEQRRPELLPDKLQTLLRVIQHIGLEYWRQQRRHSGGKWARRRRQHPQVVELVEKTNAAATCMAAHLHFIEALCVELYQRGITSQVFLDGKYRHLYQIGGLLGYDALRVLTGHQPRICMHFTIVSELLELTHTTRVVKRNLQAVGNVAAALELMADLLEACWLRSKQQRRREELELAEAKRRIEVRSADGCLGLGAGLHLLRHRDNNPEWHLDVPGGTVVIANRLVVTKVLPEVAAFIAKMQHYERLARRYNERQKQQQEQTREQETAR